MKTLFVGGIKDGQKCEAQVPYLHVPIDLGDGTYAHEVYQLKVIYGVLPDSEHWFYVLQSLADEDWLDVLMENYHGRRVVRKY